ncbi:unnamed protein product [Dibothriocephalus latus]|uniref:Fibronectin type-III domain-containing protein n=1 Tax=Dibothriocephalus latus TaxID=60516 RepID=A0A3P7NRP0_DIBLA|nr:unnamed protein product [Dibothriocephalus latus]
MISQLSVLFLVLTAEAAPYINEGSGVANSVSATEIDVSWATGSNTGTVKANDVTAVLLGGGGIAAKQTVSGAATQCTLSGLTPGRYYSSRTQLSAAKYRTVDTDQVEEGIAPMRISCKRSPKWAEFSVDNLFCYREGVETAYENASSKESPATLVLGILCGIVGTACLVIVIMIFVLKKQQGNRSLDNNLANAYALLFNLFVPSLDMAYPFNPYEYRSCKTES